MEISSSKDNKKRKCLNWISLHSDSHMRCLNLSFIFQLPWKKSPTHFISAWHCHACMLDISFSFSLWPFFLLPHPLDYPTSSKPLPRRLFAPFPISILSIHLLVGSVLFFYSFLDLPTVKVQSWTCSCCAASINRREAHISYSYSFYFMRSYLATWIH